MAASLTWTGDERRSGYDRRTITMLPDAERRTGEERRRGGIGTAHPDPTASLLGGLQVDERLAFEPRQTPGGVKPAHEPHDAIPAVAQVAGHPIHPMIVPLPIGAFTGAIVADVAYAATGDRFFARAGRLLTGAGVVTGLAAGMLGSADFLGRNAVRSHAAAWVHAGGNVAALVLGGASLALRTNDERKSVVPAGIALSLLTGGILVVTGWLGGELSYRHRVGVTTDEA